MAVARLVHREGSGPERCGEVAKALEVIGLRQVAAIRDEYVGPLGLLAQQVEALGLGRLRESAELGRVDQHDYRRELQPVAMGAATDGVDQVLGARQTGGLDEQAIRALLEDGAEGVDEALGCGAADAAAGDVRDPKGLGVLEGGLVDRGLAEVVDDHGYTLAASRIQLRSDRGGLSRAEEPGDDLDGYGHGRPQRRRLRTASASSVKSGSVRSQLMHLSVMLMP